MDDCMMNPYCGDYHLEIEDLRGQVARLQTDNDLKDKRISELEQENGRLDGTIEGLAEGAVRLAELPVKAEEEIARLREVLKQIARRQGTCKEPTCCGMCGIAKQALKEA